jgi:hypothetical protein
MRAAWAVVACVCFMQACSHPSSPIDGVKPGEYLREDFIADVCQTFSPLKSTKNDGTFQMALVNRDVLGTFISPNYYFHDGDMPFRGLPKGGDTSGMAQISSSTNVIKKKVVASMLGPERFRLQDGSVTWDFRWVGEAERWVSNAVLGGTYRDDANREYVFGSDGIAKFPDQQFDYTLLLDHTVTGYDELYSKVPERHWKVVASADGLELYPASGDTGEKVASQPQWKLKRVMPPGCK